MTCATSFDDGVAGRAPIVVLADGPPIHLRPVTPADEPLVADAIRTASPQTILHRFFTPLRDLSTAELRRLLTIDPAQGACIVGEVETPNGKRIVCGARYVRLGDPAVAEIALTVHDDFQGRGIGAFLLRQLIDRGRADGIRTFVGDVLATNTPMLRLLRGLAPRRRATYTAGVCHVEFDLTDISLSLTETPGA